jgi:hypothetical protein
VVHDFCLLQGFKTNIVFISGPQAVTILISKLNLLNSSLMISKHQAVLPKLDYQELRLQSSAAKTRPPGSWQEPD